MSVLLLGSAFAATSAWAQDAAAPATAAADTADTNVIFVTARNKSEKLQDVPLTINVLTGSQLAKQGIKDLRDIAYKTPGLIINGGGAETLTRPSLRGLPTSEGDPTVAVFYDGAYIGSSNANNIALLDLERVEVVKGPVNSLYGRPAYAGAINYVSKMPTENTDGRISMSVGNDDQVKASFAFGLTLIPDVLMVRVAAGHDGYGGGYKDKANGNVGGGYTKDDAQISVLFKPTDRLSISGRVYYGHDDFDASPFTYNDNNCGTYSSSYAGFPHYSFFCGKFDEKQKDVEFSDQSQMQSANSRRVWNMVGKVNYDLDFADISALSTYTRTKQNRFTDFTGRRNGIPYAIVTTASTGVNGTDPGTVIGYQDLVTSFGNIDNVRDFSQELRIQTKPDKPLRLTAGAYYAKATSYAATLTAVDGSDLAAGTTIKGAYSSFNYDRYFLVDGTGFSDAITSSRSHTRILSGFAGAEYDIMPNLTFGADARYMSLRRGVDLLSSNATLPAAFVPVSRSTTFNNWFGRATLRYKLTPDAMVYATVANGVKPGGFNARATSAIDLVYGEEKNMTYEAGFKTDLLGRKLTLNGSVFLIDLKDIQGTGPAKDPNTLGLVTSNIGKARSKGFELDASVRPASWLTLDGGVSYADIKYLSGTYDYSFAATCAAVGSANCDQSRIISVATAQGTNRTVYDLTGLRPSGSAKWTVSLGGDIEVPITDTVAFFANAKYRHQSRQYANNQNISWWGPLNRVDVRAGVSVDALRLTAFVDNLTKNSTPESVYQSTYLNDFSYGYFGQMPQQRRYGLTLDYTF